LFDNSEGIRPAKIAPTLQTIPKGLTHSDSGKVGR